MNWPVIVIGGGAAGLLAAARAAERGRRLLLLEKNKRPGVKILMSGGTRCNITHDTDNRGIIEAFGAQGKFLHSALAALSPSDLVELIEAEGVATKVEATGKVFPVSDKATDVLGALRRRLERSGAELMTSEPVVRIERGQDPLALTLSPEDGGEGTGSFAVITPSRRLSAEKIILCVGGKSYPGSGTKGDGYAWAAALGHTIVPPRPALAPLTTSAAWVPPLRGVTVPDVVVRLRTSDDHLLAECRGSFLFTHFGLSGPAPMDVSREVTGKLPQEGTEYAKGDEDGEGLMAIEPRAEGLMLECDFVPGQPEQDFDERLRSQAAAEGRRGVASVLSSLLPTRLAEALISQAGVPHDRRGAELSRAERQAIVRGVKRCGIPITGTLGFKKAEVTAGGVSLEEVDSRTMQSKLVPGLYFAGEILDLDGPIGGYNFQAAFSTGWLAGESV